ncbi:hypothetical protein L202_00970 [Cryptococcus amylolentus CBS 6039]|uniref:Chitin-binding type-2 domain-containing protein n=2 Tax=Cryptococcus amylolentus TaxID=104669 RepID=A0A1E3I2F4_9TREE|nr:hypothetical protein L202_00970 [Cryptococcus amylolentus CBS 6039]ODN82677.1 hypothetical protein L202_00970 [Cryptococcus amylolentus CBS 6039]ODO10370.1 hypothetical protein I350_00965 [Cryptococcus amylolentus CBS 6273]
MLFGNALSLLALAGYVSANGLGLDLGVTVNVGVGLDLRLGAPSSVRDQCSNKGDFLSDLLGRVFCCSDDNRTDPEDGLTCPKGWSMHKEEKCCIPPTETATCDCGEGYTYNESTKKCDKIQGSCPDGTWYHRRSSSCIDNSKPSDPISDILCPLIGWVLRGDRCEPEGEHSPEPSTCPEGYEWSPQSCTCGGGGSPSQRALAARHTGILYGANSFKARQLAR